MLASPSETVFVWELAPQRSDPSLSVELASKPSVGQATANEADWLQGQPRSTQLKSFHCKHASVVASSVPKKIVSNAETKKGLAGKRLAVHVVLMRASS